MNVKEKAALIATFVSFILTLLKFIIFFLSGSTAILSEAFHSFADIATSILVYISIRAERIIENKKIENENKTYGNESANSNKDKIKKFIKHLLKRATPELTVSFAIGVFLLFVSILLLFKVVCGKDVAIEKPLFAGITFVIFSVGSYFLYKFETNVGEVQKSPALISDGLHSKADMFSSLLTGFSLIIYTLGLNLDRLVGSIIALFIMSFAVETLVNVGSTIIYGKKFYAIQYKSYKIIASIFTKTNWDKILKLFDKRLKLHLEESKIFNKSKKWVPRLLIVIALFSYLSTCIITIKTGEEAVIERFGRPLSATKFIQSGLHIKYPWPIDKVVKFKTKEINHIQLGNITDKNIPALLWTKKHGEEIHFIAGDNSYFNPYITVHYRIKNIYNFKYIHNNPAELMEYVSYGILCKIFAKMSFTDIAVTHRKQIQQDFKTNLQQELDILNSGLEIINVMIKDIHPPIVISSSYEDVIAAFQEKQKLIYDAIAYRNSELPIARGNAVKEIENAQAYVTDKIKHAEGDGTRFSFQVDEFNRTETITTKRLYLEAVCEYLTENEKILIDPKAGIPDIWVNFDKVKFSVE